MSKYCINLTIKTHITDKQSSGFFLTEWKLPVYEAWSGHTTYVCRAEDEPTITTKFSAQELSDVGITGLTLAMYEGDARHWYMDYDVKIALKNTGYQSTLEHLMDQLVKELDCSLSGYVWHAIREFEDRLKRSTKYYKKSDGKCNLVSVSLELEDCGKVIDCREFDLEPNDEYENCTYATNRLDTVGYGFDINKERKEPLYY